MEVFPEYQNWKPFNRQVPHTLLNDIVPLAASIAQKSPCNDLEKVFHPVLSNQTLTDDSSRDIAALIETVNLLTARVIGLEEEVAVLKAVVKLDESTHTASDNTTSAAMQPSSPEVVALSDQTHHSMDAQQLESEYDVTDSAPEVQIHSHNQADLREDQNKRRSSSTPNITCPQAPNPPVEFLSNGSGSSNDSENQMQPPRQRRVEYSTRRAPFSKLYVGDVHPQSTTDDLITFMTSIGTVIAENDVTVLVANDVRRSYCVQVPTSKLLSLYEAKWPRGIYIQPFHGSSATKRGLRGSFQRPKQQQQ